MVIISSYAQGMVVRSQARMWRRPPQNSHFGKTEREEVGRHLTPPRLLPPSCQAPANSSKGKGPGAFLHHFRQGPLSQASSIWWQWWWGGGQASFLPQTPFSVEVLSFSSRRSSPSSPPPLCPVTWRGWLQREPRVARAGDTHWPYLQAAPREEKLSQTLSAREERKPDPEKRPTKPWGGGGVKARGSHRALATKGDPGPFMCFTKVAKLRWDYNCSSPCQGWKVGSLKYAPAVLMKSLKSNKREKRARKVTCITLIKEKSHREVVNLNHCLNFNLFINRICPSLRMLLLPLPLSNNSRHNERVWQKVKCLVINSFNWKKREEGEREVPLQEQKTEGLEEGARLKFA